MTDRAQLMVESVRYISVLAIAFASAVGAVVDPIHLLARAPQAAPAEEDALDGVENGVEDAVGEAETPPSTTTSVSSPPSPTMSSTPPTQPIFMFTQVPDGVTCGSMSISWLYSGDDTSSLDLYVTNQFDSADAAYPLTNLLETYAVGDDSNTYNWDPIDVPSGPYVVLASYANTTSVSDVFTIDDGDSSCLPVVPPIPSDTDSSSPTGTSETQTGTDSATGRPTSTGGSNSNASITNTNTDSATNTAIPAVGAVSSNSMSSGAVAGVVIGVLALLAALLGVCLVFRFRRNRSRSRSPRSPTRARFGSGSGSGSGFGSGLFEKKRFGAGLFEKRGSGSGGLWRVGSANSTSNVLTRPGARTGAGSGAHGVSRHSTGSQHSQLSQLSGPDADAAYGYGHPAYQYQHGGGNLGLGITGGVGVGVGRRDEDSSSLKEEKLTPTSASPLHYLPSLPALPPQHARGRDTAAYISDLPSAGAGAKLGRRVSDPFANPRQSIPHNVNVGVASPPMGKRTMSARKPVPAYDGAADDSYESSGHGHSPTSASAPASAHDHPHQEIGHPARRSDSRSSAGRGGSGSGGSSPERSAGGGDWSSAAAVSHASRSGSAASVHQQQHLKRPGLPELNHKSSFGDKPMHYLMPDMPPDMK